MSEIVQQDEEYELEVWQGKDFDLEVVLTEDDGVTLSSLVGVTAKGQIRQYVGAPLVAEFTFDINTTTSTIHIMLDAVDTRKVVRGCIYDIELIEAGSPIGLLHGPVTVIPGVTQ